MAMIVACFSIQNGVGERGGRMQGQKWDKRFMQMAGLVSSWSSCYQQNRQVGAVVVRDKRILASGYNGAPQGVKSCAERGECLRRKRNIPSGTQHEICYATHAEQNAILQGARMGIAMQGATLYTTHQPCVLCARIIINAGIVRVVYAKPYPDAFAVELLEEAGIALERMEDKEEEQP